MGMETNVGDSQWGIKRNAEMKSHFTLMLLLLCSNDRKEI